MRKKTKAIAVDSAKIQNILRNVQDFRQYILLNSNPAEQMQQDQYGKYDFLAGIGSIHELSDSGKPFEDLHTFLSSLHDWCFGFFCYDLKNSIEKLQSENKDKINFPDLHFFQPRYVVYVKENNLYSEFLSEIETEAEAELMLQKLLSETEHAGKANSECLLESTLSREDYLDRFAKIKSHIQRGDVYEINFCNEFYAQGVSIDAGAFYSKLNNISPMPFSSMLRLNNNYAICASPERFLARRGNKIISQPMKGTARRGRSREDDEKIIENLFNDPKERSENVMIVDLVRNDLSRTADKGSVEVEKLFGISSFKRLHQMISTVISKVGDEVRNVDIIRNAFPMGSMTGAPKVRAMELIEEYETTKRGLFSGSIGYFDPEGDFDFNVVIRTILYNAENKYLSYMAGSAITINADASQEYDECMLKAETLREALGEHF